MSSLNNTFISKCGHLQVSVNAKSTPKTIHFPNKIVLILEEFLSDMTIPNMFPTPLVPHIESLPTFNRLGPGFTCLRLWPYLFFYHLVSCIAAPFNTRIFESQNYTFNSSLPLCSFFMPGRYSVNTSWTERITVLDLILSKSPTRLIA